MAPKPDPNWPLSSLSIDSQNPTSLRSAKEIDSQNLFSYFPTGRNEDYWDTSTNRVCTARTKRKYTLLSSRVLKTERGRCKVGGAPQHHWDGPNWTKTHFEIFSSPLGFWVLVLALSQKYTFIVCNCITSLSCLQGCSLRNTCLDLVSINILSFNPHTGFCGLFWPQSKSLYMPNC